MQAQMKTAHMLVAVVIASFTPALAGSTSAEYKIGAQDRLRVKVNEWPALSDEVVVSEDGRVSLPIVGSVTAAGNNTSGLAAMISRTLQERANLAEPPHTSVEVSRFRPFYILGDVQRPGEYPYRPGLTVLMAVSISGGAYRPEIAQLRPERDATLSKADLSTAEIREQQLLVRLARLQAELSGKPNIDLGAVSQRQYPPELVAEEASILRARTSTFANQITGHRRLIEISKEGIDFLRARMDSAVKQKASAEKELASLQTLSDKGLSLVSRNATTERLISQIEGDQRDIDARIARARQDIAQSEASIAELTDRRQSELRMEIRNTSAQLDEIKQQIAMHRALIREAETLGSTSQTYRAGWRQAQLRYRITRLEAEGPRELSVQGNDRVEPEDVIIVERYVDESQLVSDSLSNMPRPTYSNFGSK